MKTDTVLQSVKSWLIKETLDEVVMGLCGPILEAGGEWDTGGERGLLTLPYKEPWAHPGGYYHYLRGLQKFLGNYCTPCYALLCCV